MFSCRANGQILSTSWRFFFFYGLFVCYFCFCLLLDFFGVLSFVGFFFWVFLKVVFKEDLGRRNDIYFVSKLFGLFLITGT